jgi:hypothetical protein
MSDNFQGRDSRTSVVCRNLRTGTGILLLLIVAGWLAYEGLAIG